MAGLFEVRLMIAIAGFLVLIVPFWLAEVREELQLRREGRVGEV